MIDVEYIACSSNLLAHMRILAKSNWSDRRNNDIIGLACRYRHNKKSQTFKIRILLIGVAPEISKNPWTDVNWKE